MTTARREALNQAFQRLESVLPDRTRPTLQWLHSRRSRPVRIPLAILCLIGSFFWYLPVVGLELFPIGLLLIAHDVPFLRRPAAGLVMWLLDGYEWLQRSWKRLRPRRRQP